MTWWARFRRRHRGINLSPNEIRAVQTLATARRLGPIRVIASKGGNLTP